MFQSPRSGKFVSDETLEAIAQKEVKELFQSPRSGKFVSDIIFFLKDKKMSKNVSIP